MGASVGCPICRDEAGDRELGRRFVWGDDLWRVSTSLIAPVAGFSYLEPRRHIPHVTDLDGAEAAGFGVVLARVTRVLRSVTGADLVYCTVFGERVAHFHVNLVPHRDGDGLRGGAGLLDGAAEPLPREIHEALARSLGERLAAG